LESVTVRVYVPGPRLARVPLPLIVLERPSPMSERGLITTPFRVTEAEVRIVSRIPPEVEPVKA